MGGRGSTVRRRATAAAVLAACALGVAACGGPSTVPASSGPSTSTTVPPGVRPAVCPRQAPDPLTPTPPGAAVPGSTDVLVPAAPAAATLCQYSGVGQSGGTIVLAGSRVVTGPTLDLLVAFLDSSHWPVVSGAAEYSCPEWNGATDLALFAYPSGPDVTVDADLGGCGFASNGTRTVSGYAIGQHLAALIRS